MSEGQQQGRSQYGVSNLEYDLVQTLSNLLESQEVLTRYARDAEQAGDQECAKLFRDLQEHNRQVAQQFRSHLARHLGGGR